MILNKTLVLTERKLVGKIINTITDNLNIFLLDIFTWNVDLKNHIYHDLIDIHFIDNYRNKISESIENKNLLFSIHLQYMSSTEKIIKIIIKSFSNEANNTFIEISKMNTSVFKKNMSEIQSDNVFNDFIQKINYVTKC